jgi:hypothetical protein
MYKKQMCLSIYMSMYHFDKESDFVYNVVFWVGTYAYVLEEHAASMFRFEVF